MASKTEVQPYSASEVRAWLKNEGREVGNRGRLSIAKIEAYLTANPDRCKELLKAANRWPRNNRPSDTLIASFAVELANPGTSRRPKAMAESAAETAPEA